MTIRPALLLSMTVWLAVLVVGPGEAAAKTPKVTYHSYQQVWPAAVRFLRVDAGFEIVEKDAEAGYVIFEVSEDNKRFRGSLELVRFRDEKNRPAVRLLLHIEDRPSYMEQGLLDRLERKLRDEIGEPAPPKSEPDPSDKPGKPDKNDKGSKPGQGATPRS